MPLNPLGLWLRISFAASLLLLLVLLPNVHIEGGPACGESLSNVRLGSTYVLSLRVCIPSA